MLDSGQRVVGLVFGLQSHFVPNPTADKIEVLLSTNRNFPKSLTLFTKKHVQVSKVLLAALSGVKII